MDLDQFKSGEFEQDAAVPEVINEELPEETHVEPELSDEPEDTTEPLEEPEEAELPPQQKDAFVKRMEREKEKLRQELEQEIEGKYSKHKKLIDMMGGDPDKLEAALLENQRQQEAQRLAEQNGWDEDQTAWYMEDQKQKQELQELKVQVSITNLSRTGDYPGIESMQQAILNKVQQYKGMTVEEAYWAIGGKARAEQMQREAQQREVARRSQTPRTVQSDGSASPASGTPILPPEIEAQRKRLGLSAKEAQQLLTVPDDLDSYRAWKNQKK